MEEHKVKINISFAGMLSRYGFEFEEKDSDLFGYYAHNGAGTLIKPHYYVLAGAIGNAYNMADIGVSYELFGSTVGGAVSIALDLRLINGYIFSTNIAWRLHGYSLWCLWLSRLKWREQPS